MITEFNDKMFIFKKINNVLSALVVYFISYKLPIFVMMDKAEILHRINIKDVYVEIENIKMAFLTVDVGIICFLLEVINWIGNYFCFIDEKIAFNGDDRFSYCDYVLIEDRLDVSNSFLYSHKTHALLE